MANLDGFDAEQQQSMRTFDALPKGDYLGMITDSEMKDTKAGDGKYLQLTWEIVEGEAKGRSLWSRLNLENKSQQAVDIAKRELGDICKAIGVLRPKDSMDLHGKLVVLSVSVKKRNDTGERTNDIKGYKAANGSAPQASQTAAPQAASAPVADKPPWA